MSNLHDYFYKEMLFVLFTFGAANLFAQPNVIVSNRHRDIKKLLVLESFFDVNT